MDKAFVSFIDWLKEEIISALDKFVQLRMMELDGTLWNKKEVAKQLGMTPESFNTYRYEYEQLGFPKALPGNRWKKLAVLRWLADEH